VLFSKLGEKKNNSIQRTVMKSKGNGTREHWAWGSSSTGWKKKDFAMRQKPEPDFPNISDPTYSLSAMSPFCFCFLSSYNLGF
jgi:hypothetical protein